MKRNDQKSHCAVNFALEAIGDPWSLLVVRDIAFNGKHTYKEFLDSEERIAKNILADRLQKLTSAGIISGITSEHDRRTVIYSLTSKGVDLVPVLLELSRWSVKHDPLTDASREFAQIYERDPAAITKAITDGVQNGRAAFAGDNSVAKDIIKQSQKNSYAT